jgi:lantibiotic modifying enzyme
MLYDPKAFEPLTDDEWNEERARERIREIVADAERAYDPDALWPAQEWDVWGTTPPLKALYAGAAGVAWALDTLRRRGYADVRIDLAQAVQRALELWQDEPEFAHEGSQFPTPREPSLHYGEGGILAVLWRLAPSAEIADRLHARVRENRDNAADEIMWGAPGTMLIARALHDWTGEDRWLDAWKESADGLRSRRDADGLWTNQLYGTTFRSLGPPHGAVGNTLALGEPHDATRETLAREAVVEDGIANWPSRVGGELEREGEIRVQWCCGAPGIVASASTYLDEELVLAGAELIWRAGPHGPEKGAGLCHGTAGNGFALLKTFERTGDEQWLDRARRFAMRALDRTQNRYSLWTGDVGVALFAAECIEARARFPILDSWD